MDDAQQGRLEAERFDRLAELGVSFEETLDGKLLEKDEDRADPVSMDWDINWYLAISYIIHD